MVTLIKADPIGQSEPSPCHINTGPDSSKHRWEMRSHPIYDVTKGKPFMRARIRAGLTVRDASRMASLSLTEISGLEHGRYQCSDDDWRKIWLAVIGEEPWPPESLCSACDGRGNHPLDLFTGRGPAISDRTCAQCNGTGRQS